MTGYGFTLTKGKFIGLTALLATLALAGCKAETAEERYQRLKQELSKDYESAQTEGFGLFPLQTATWRSYKESRPGEFSWSLEERTGKNKTEAPIFTYMVTKAFADQMSKKASSDNTEVDRIHNTGGDADILDGDFSDINTDYVMRITGASATDVYCLIQRGACKPITEEQYNILMDINKTEGRYEPDEHYKAARFISGEFGSKPDYTLQDLFEKDSCEITVVTHKNDISLTLGDLMQRGKYLTITRLAPRAFCDVEPGDRMDAKYSLWDAWISPWNSETHTPYNITATVSNVGGRTWLINNESK